MQKFSVCYHVVCQCVFLHIAVATFLINLIVCRYHYPRLRFVSWSLLIGLNVIYSRKRLTRHGDSKYHLLAVVSASATLCESWYIAWVKQVIVDVVFYYGLPSCFPIVTIECIVKYFQLWRTSLVYSTRDYPPPPIKVFFVPSTPAVNPNSLACDGHCCCALHLCLNWSHNSILLKTAKCIWLFPTLDVPLLKQPVETQAYNQWMPAWWVQMN